MSNLDFEVLVEVDTSDFEKDLEHIINKHCKENDSNTPDFLLAKYMLGCLEVYNTAVKARDKWYGFSPFGESKNLPSNDDCVNTDGTI